jgi:HprK-related kinase A
VILAEIDRREVRRRLRTNGLRLRIGPLVAEVRSSLDAIDDAIGWHYGDYKVADNDEFADFHVSIRTTGVVRRYIRPKVIFSFDGREPFKPLPASQAFPLLEWGLNWCISTQCHQYLIIHAAVVETGGQAILLPAPPGSGKSTLCAALVARGWRLLSDELALIDVQNGNLTAMPRPISLKNDSIAAISQFWRDASLTPPIHGTVKGTIAHARVPRRSVEDAERRAVPRWVIIPRYGAGLPTTLDAIPKASAFMQLVENAFNYSVHGRAGFEVIADVVQRCECRSLTYGGSLEEAISRVDGLAAPP